MVLKGDLKFKKKPNGLASVVLLQNDASFSCLFSQFRLVVFAAMDGLSNLLPAYVFFDR
jgi:hypothetical protein